ncbi:siderophore-interacting protein [Mycetocola tolaasinivorans]|uniref:Siderophore-interacting protein n=1 Tax=Mycetocola tolaasinivorans TaxID=76635 RepID=A0A3L7ADR4_9MICO|nr:siderophore-interacting protein [Mycetocola tolaasinivorans]RLP77532.1 siderophore-interacting protein [Mycetocola tolaasinivorans]
MSAYFGTVTAVTPLSPGLVRVTLHDPGLSGFPSTDVGDEYVRVHFPELDGTLQEPTVEENGNWSFAGEYPHVAPYTIRRFSAADAEIDIDFVLHGHGHAATWAKNAAPGDRLLFGSPRGLYDAPDHLERYLFVTDATGIPALGRLLERLPATAHARAIIEVAEADHRIELTSPAALETEWISGRGNGVAPSAMTEALRAMSIQPGTYVWVAGEAGELRDARRLLRHELKVPGTSMKIIGYWRHNSEEWITRWEALDESVTTRLSQLWENPADEELARDAYEDQLERLGL